MPVTLKKEGVQTEVSATSYSLPYFPICYVLTSPLTHKSNTVELNRIYLPRVYGRGSDRGSDRRPERRREGWEMMRRSIGPWAVTPLARFHIHLHPSSLRPSETDTTPPFSGRPGRFCRRGCFGPAIIRLSVGSMTSCGQRSVVAPAPIAR